MYMNSMSNLKFVNAKLLGEHAGKCISAETAKQARKIVVGG